jgi:hypothetical protein
MRKLAFFAGYGLLPLWGAIVVVFIGSLSSGSRDYWNVAPWLIIFSIPICVATLLAATMILAVHAYAIGDEVAKKKAATKAFWWVNAVFVAIVGAWLLYLAGLKWESDNDEKNARHFVQTHGTVVQQFGPEAELRVISWSARGPRELPSQYEFEIDAKRPLGPSPDSRYISAIVDVKASPGKRLFVLRCITAVPFGKRDSFKDPCEQ